VEGGILRGQGRQHLGGIANVIVYWFIALPAGLALAFKADWGLYGLWAGMVWRSGDVADGSYLRWDCVRRYWGLLC
jgi:Na+-driven multidrug efflux pump